MFRSAVIRDCYRLRQLLTSYRTELLIMIVCDTYLVFDLTTIILLASKQLQPITYLVFQA